MYHVTNLKIKAKKVGRMRNTWFKTYQRKTIGFQVEVMS